MSPSFGGTWTDQKLEILGRYLDAYTTALKSQPFQLTYVDAFAGEGTYLADSDYLLEDYEDLQEFRAGSPRIALEVQDKPFDKLVFVEKDPARCESLRLLESEFPNRNVGIRNEDANSALPAFCATLGNSERAVVFLDPFATQVSWSTVEELARTQKIDCWILFPLMAIARMMPTSREPPDSLALQLDRIFGGRNYWEELYSETHYSYHCCLASRHSSAFEAAIELQKDTAKDLNRCLRRLHQHLGLLGTRKTLRCSNSFFVLAIRLEQDLRSA